MAKTIQTELSFLRRILSADSKMNSIDWDATPLGPMATWPEALKLSLGILLYSPLPKLICWGKDLNCVYNNAFVDFMKSRHRAAGVPGVALREAFPFLFRHLSPSIAKILSREEMTCNYTFGITAEDRVMLPAGVYNFLCNAIFESDEKIGGILITLRDSKDIREPDYISLREPASFDTILSLVNVGIAHLAGDDFRVTYINNAFLEMAGKPPGYFAGKTIFELFPDKKDFFIPIFEKIYASGKSLQQNQVAVKFLRNGVPVEFFLSLVFYPVMNKQGIQESVMVIAVDETELVQQKHWEQEREKFFATIVSNSRMGFLILRGEHFLIEYANEIIFKKIWQIEAEKALGKPLLELFPELENQKYAQQIRDVYYKKKRITEKKSRVFINSGKGLREFYLDYEYAPLFGLDGTINGVSVSIYDMTAEVNLERKKQEAQQLLEISLEATGLGLWERDAPGHLTHTEELSKIFGYPKGQKLTLDRILSHIHLKDRVLQEEAYAAAIETGLYQYEARIIKPDGKLAYIRVRGKMFFDDQDKPEKIIGTTRDITQERRNQKELIRKEQRLRKLILHAPVAIGILRGPDYKVEIINEAARRLLGRKEEQLLGKPILDVMNEMDTVEAKYLLDKVFYKGETVSAKEYPARILRKGKIEKIFVNFEYDPVRNEQNEVIGIMVVGTEVTDQVVIRKKIEASEQQFRLLANSVPHLVWISDKQGNILFTNQTMETYTGFSCDVLNRNGIWLMVHPEEKERVQKKWNRALMTTTEFIDEHRIAGRDGRYRWYLTRAVPMRNEGEHVQYWIATSTDIQEMKEQDLQKDYFISRASHELKTPITSLKGYVQILLNVYQKHPEKLLTTSLERMELQVNKLNMLIEELLDTTRLNSGGIEIDATSTDLIPLLKETIDDIATAYPGRQIDFTACDSIPLKIDKSRMSQVMNNLLTNAIKYSPNKLPISVAAGIEGNMAKVSVKDEGIGMEKHHLRNIFEKFYRVSGKNEDTFPGFGIGLFLVYEIVKKHGGHVEVESEPGRGSCFTVFIPIEEQDSF